MMEVPTDKRRETWDKWQTRKQFLVLVITTHIYPIMLIIEMYVVALNYVLIRKFGGPSAALLFSPVEVRVALQPPHLKKFHLP